MVATVGSDASSTSCAPDTVAATPWMTAKSRVTVVVELVSSVSVDDTSVDSEVVPMSSGDWMITEKFAVGFAIARFISPADTSAVTAACAGVLAADSIAVSTTTANPIMQPSRARPRRPVVPCFALRCCCPCPVPI